MPPQQHLHFSSEQSDTSYVFIIYTYTHTRYTFPFCLSRMLNQFVALALCSKFKGCSWQLQSWQELPIPGTLAGAAAAPFPVRASSCNAHQWTKWETHVTWLGLPCSLSKYICLSHYHSTYTRMGSQMGTYCSLVKQGWCELAKGNGLHGSHADLKQLKFCWEMFLSDWH